MTNNANATAGKVRKSLTFSRNSRTIIRGVPYLHFKETTEGHIFRRMDGALPGGDDRSDFDESTFEIFSHAEILELHNDNDNFQYDADFYTITRQSLIASGKSIPLSDLDEDEQARSLFKFGLTTGVAAHLQTLGSKNHYSDAEIKDAISTVLQIMLAETARTMAAAGKDPTWARLPMSKVSLSAFKKWRRKMSELGEEPQALIDGRMNSGNFTPRYTPAIEALITKYVSGYLDLRRPSQETQYGRLIAEIERQIKDGANDLFYPSERAFFNRINKLEAFPVAIARYGRKEAEKIFRTSNGGQDIYYPGQRTEFDAWEIELYTLLLDEGAFDEAAFTPKELKRIKKAKIWVVVVIDVFTRCFTGIQFGFSEDTTAVNFALQMSVSDKNDLARACGCRSDWPMYSAGLISRDTGSANISNEVNRVALEIFKTEQRAVVKMPWMRGTVERAIGTMAMQFATYFTGSTHGGVVNRHGAEPENEASLPIFELRKLLVQYIVDKYHREVHSALGMSPYDMWHKMLEIHPPPPRINPFHVSTILGIRDTRRLSGRGIQFLNNWYNSEDLQRTIRRRQPHALQKKVRVGIRIDPANLGYIAVSDGRIWHRVYGPSELQNVTMEQVQDFNEMWNAEAKISHERGAEFRNAFIRHVTERSDYYARRSLQKTVTDIHQIRNAERAFLPNFARPFGGESNNQDDISDPIPAGGDSDLPQLVDLDESELEANSWHLPVAAELEAAIPQPEFDYGQHDDAGADTSTDDGASDEAELSCDAAPSGVQLNITEFDD